MPIPIPGRIAEIVRQSTVHVGTGAGRRAQSSGSGVVIAPGQVITNSHVVRGHDIQVESWEGVTHQAKVMKQDATRDLALLAVDGLRSNPMTMGDSDRVRAGTTVLAIGNPMGFMGAVSSGVIHSLESRWICADVHLAPGNSGGPLADFSGHLLGINTLVAAGGLAYAIPSRDVQRFLANAPHHQLGVVVRAVQFQPSRIGLLVLGVVPNSAAERASLMPGDILAGSDGQNYKDVDDLPKAIEEAREGVLHLDFYRGNHSLLRHVTANLQTDRERSAA